MLNKQQIVEDIGYFAREVLGITLHDKQKELITSSAKRIIACCGRKFGKTEASIIKAVHTAIVKPASRILIVSTGEREAKEVLSRLKRMIEKSPLSGIIVDENKSEAKFSNESEVICLPNNPATIRGYSDVRLIILDEASLLQKEIDTAVEPMGITLPDSQLMMIGTPFSKHHFFYEYWTKGNKQNDESIVSFHYPSSCNPHIPAKELQWLKENKSEIIWRRDYMAEWISDMEAFFPMEILEGAILDYPLEYYYAGATKVNVVIGIDWGRKWDQTVVIGLSLLKEFTDHSRPAQDTWFISLFKAFPPNTSWAEMMEGIEILSDNFDIVMCHSESLGLGSQATETLKEWRKFDVREVKTTNAVKQQMFDLIYALLLQGRLILPREPELIRQLSNLRINITESGQSQIRHSEDYKHDDYADALGFAALATKNKFIPESAYTDKKINPDSNRKIPERPIATRLFRAMVCGQDGSRYEPKPEMKPNRRRFPYYIATSGS